MSYYEELRGRVISGEVRALPGLAVLFSRGMAALMQLLEQMPTFHKSNEMKSQHETKQATRLPDSEQQIIQLIASMVMGRHQEAIHVH